jgi:2'-5' RNA ligase
MTYSIGAYFDQETETEIRRIWKALAVSQAAEYLYVSNDRPHITLSIFDNLDQEKTSQLMCSLAHEFPVMEVSFQSIGIFPSNAVFLAPIVSPTLLDLQRRSHESLISFSKLPDHPYFVPGNWVPHCSLAIEFLPEKIMGVLQAVMQEARLPLNGKITALGLTSFRPVVHLMSCELNTDPSSV